ncbi:MAG: GGDEF domain-containing protein [Lachnospiraceae bacterium]|nr:GGDEF domain-containing protein [Lachnospiraceae bacterium]
MRFPLKRKAIVLIVAIAMLLSAVSLIFSTRLIRDIIDVQFKTRATDLAATVAVTVDSGYAASLQRAISEIYDSTENKVGSDQWGSPEFEEYISNYSHLSESMGYNTLLETLRAIQEMNSVDCIYLIYVDEPTDSVIYMVDADPVDACPIGCIDPIYDINRGIFDNPERGFPAYITDTEEYGWLVTAASPVHDIMGNVVCYAAVDISMEAVRASQQYFMLLAVLAQSVMTLIICILGILLVNHFIVDPINLLSGAADRYCSEHTDDFRHGFEDIEIHTGDEIETLSDSMKQMERDINEHIANLTATMEELRETRAEADRMDKMASRDALTGVRNRRAYDEETKAMEEEQSFGREDFGIVMIDLNDLKKINDTCGHDAGDTAIQKLCHLICAIFVHSPVFRIGGDEFTIILRKRDLGNVKALVAYFNKSIEILSKDTSLEPAERISAAIGYAVFDPSKDRSVDDVFKRADEAMYERKKAMKSTDS